MLGLEKNINTFSHYEYLLESVRSNRRECVVLGGGRWTNFKPRTRQTKNVNSWRFVPLNLDTNELGKRLVDLESV